MKEVVIDCEKVELTDLELSGLDRLFVSVSASHTESYLAGLRKLHPTLSELVGLKLPAEASLPEVKREKRDSISRRTGKTIVRGATIMYERINNTREFRDLWIDTNFSKDGQELIANVDAAVSKFDNYVGWRQEELDDERLKLRLKNGLPPRFVSILLSHMTDTDELSEAVAHARQHFTPIAVVSSSKQKKEMNDRYGFDHKALTASFALMALDSGITSLSTAAKDAPLIRDVLSSHARYDELEIFGYGAILGEQDSGEHDEAVKVAQVRDSVNYFGVGGAVLLHNKPDIHLIEYAREIAA